MSADSNDPHGLSHIEGEGQSARARMVDVGAKPVTRRRAVARARVVFPEGVLGSILDGGGPKGPIEETCRIAGILAAKRTGELIPTSRDPSKAYRGGGFEDSLFHVRVSVRGKCMRHTREETLGVRPARRIEPVRPVR